MVKENDAIAIIIILLMTFGILVFICFCRFCMPVRDVDSGTDTEKGITPDGDHDGDAGNRRALVPRTPPGDVIRMPAPPVQSSGMRAPRDDVVVGDNGIRVPRDVGRDSGIRVPRQPQAV